MSEIVNYNSVSITQLMSNLAIYKYNPSNIQRIILDYLDELTNGEVDIVDPTNPFVFLLEASAVNTALCINENVINLRKQYASLSQTEEEIYLHMSDKDYINRFAVPSFTDFTVVVQVNDLLSKMVYDTSESCFKVTIPRDTEFRIDGYVFTLQYPISIRRYNNGVVQISYDNTYESPLQTLTSNIIDYVVRTDVSLVDWIFFKIPVSQFLVESTYFVLQNSSTFSENVMFVDQFYYCRVYYKNNNTLNKWKEMITTHTDQVFDPFKPTAVLTVFSDQINVYIPYIYVSSGLISGEIRVDVFTTKGELTLNLGNYKIASFESRLKAIDEERDLDDYTVAMRDVIHYSYSDQIISGGTNGIDFKTMRERVIFNSVGDRQLPITNVQLDSFVSDKGFNLVKNVDVITNRIFLATQKLPKPLNKKLLTAANIGISSIITNIAYLKTLDNIFDNNNRITIGSDNLFLNDNGRVSILTKNQIEAIKAQSKSAMVNYINSKQYLYNPFYYVLDSSENEFEVRAYHLDQPKASNLSFKSQNQTLQLPVNTASYSLIKTTSGYKLTIVSKSTNFYQQLPDNLVNVQLAFQPVGEVFLAYINGTLVGRTADNERIYEFDIVSNHDINNKNLLCINNAKMFANEDIQLFVDLKSTFKLLYATSSLTTDYLPDSSDSLLGKFILAPGSATVTYETLELEFGVALKNLWTRSRSMAAGVTYDRYQFDIPMLYENDVYAIDPVTGSIFTIGAEGQLVYNITHHRGDPVLDNDDNQIYKHRAGDVKLDNEGNPIVIANLSTDKDIDLLFVDGKYYFADDATFINYKTEISNIISTWVINDIKAIQDRLLEQTKIYFYPKTTLDTVKVYPNNSSEVYIPSEQTLALDLYVPDSIYKDNEIRQQLINGSINILDRMIGDITINLTSITILLKDYYGDSVTSVNITGLGGTNNFNILNLASEHNRLCLKKKLLLQQDGTMIIQEDVIVNFHNVERILEGN